MVAAWPMRLQKRGIELLRVLLLLALELTPCTPLALQAARLEAIRCHGSSGCRGEATAAALPSLQSATSHGSFTRDAKLVVWVGSYARSGSSTLMSLVTHTNHSVFSVFEPCHRGDVIDPLLEAQGCGVQLLQIAQCNFTGIYYLWGWEDRHSVHPNGGRWFTQVGAEQACKAADIIALKTITYDHALTSALPVLQADPRFRILDLVRDPRSIYASMRATRGYYQEVQNGTDGMRSICASYAANLGFSHPRVHRVVYERLAAFPRLTARQIYGFLGLPMSSESQTFIERNFNADCPSTDPFGDCRSHSRASIFRYQSLSNNEYAAFMASSSCRETSQHYGYDLWFYEHSGCSGRHIAAGFALPALLALAELVNYLR